MKEIKRQRDKVKNRMKIKARGRKGKERKSALMINCLEWQLKCVSQEKVQRRDSDRATRKRDRKRNMKRIECKRKARIASIA